MSKSYCEKILHETIKTIFEKEEDLIYTLDHNPKSEVFFTFANRKKLGNDKFVEVSIKLKNLRSLDKGDDKEWKTKSLDQVEK